MKKIFIILLLTLIFIAGCDNKKAITKKEFKSKIEESNFTVINSINQFQGYDYIKTAYLAYDEYNNQIEFYSFDDYMSATSFYEVNKKMIQSEEMDTSGIERIKKTYKSYMLTTDSKYFYLSQIENTVIFTSIKVKYKDKITDIIKKLGY